MSHNVEIFHIICAFLRIEEVVLQKLHESKEGISAPFAVINPPRYAPRRLVIAFSISTASSVTAASATLTPNSCNRIG